MVAAIVLGMGGSTKIINRQKLGEFVQNGKEEATIEVSLYKNAQKQLIRFQRKFAKNGKSSYQVSWQNMHIYVFDELKMNW